MKLLFTPAPLGNAFNALISAARGCGPSQPRSSELSLMGAAVRFSIQLAIDVAALDQVHARALESTLITTLATWVDEEGVLALRLWTHDMSCVLGDLQRAARHYAHPQLPSSEGMLKYVMETLPRHLVVSAVAFAIQLAIEETDLDAGEMRGLESELIGKLEAPWEVGEIPLSVDVAAGKTWGSLPAKDPA